MATIYCNNKDKKINNKIHKPIYVDAVKWNKILSHMGGEPKINISEKEFNHKEYLKKCSKQMISKWPQLGRIEVDNTKYNKKKNDKLVKDKYQYKQLKRNDEELRQNQVEKSQQLIQRSKIGPKELESAAILSEVLRAQEIQRNFNADLNKMDKVRKAKDGAQLHIQAVHWIEDQQNKMCEEKKRNNEYKLEVYTQLKEAQKRRLDFARCQLEVEKRISEQAANDLKKQIERERAIMQRKKQVMMENSLEAFRMIEERRKREKEQDELDDKQVEKFLTEKQKLLDMRQKADEEFHEKVQQYKEANIKKVFAPIEKVAPTEDELLNKAVFELSLKLDQQERDIIQQKKLAKQARVKQYIKDIETQKFLKAQQKEEYRQSIENRIQNEQINVKYYISEQQEKMKNNKKIRDILMQQINEREKQKKEEKAEDTRPKNENPEEDDRHFLQYANSLINDAKTKSRPLLPLLKAVKQYKKQHEIGLEKGEPRHLISQVPIGEKQYTKFAPYTQSAEHSSQLIIKYDFDKIKNLNI